ncbi:sensor histidine kinase [Iamia sp. SCSIO 61187]|uniref:sensor histidine kinase n=1 Tax=Iamia sp. SCSIO 61187 TaxID=2722752 RepID=UPI001C62B503|nr:sensor histidine kinase [Iamia sp. SCSIO 61187]QYG95020.1 sensor histidine kinase [Iamia sp. SCSIO 61187]
MATAATSPPRTGWLRVLGLGASAPVAPRTLQALVHVVTDLFAALVTSSTIIALAVLAAVTLPIVPLSVILFALLLVASWLTGHVERFRIAATTGIVLSSPHRHHDGPLASRVWRWLRSAATWKELGYHLVHLPKSVVFATIVVGAWSVGLALLTLPLYLGSVPAEEARLGWWRVNPGSEALLAAALGAVILLTAPWVTRGLSRLSLGMAEGLLAGGEAEVLRQRVASVVASRAEVVDAAEAERRRIERDLHDGAQQRLVALAMSLGLAKEKMESDPAAARALVDEAHREAKNALVELRDLARGLHPPVLTDRGLHSAVAGLASRAPVPVEVDLRVARRAPPSIEGIAYFVISESLTNVARHSGAHRARVLVADEGSRLVVEVSDDGIGGASADRGTGLRGLADRVRAVDGTFRVTSPTGGPSTIRAELPLPAPLGRTGTTETPTGTTGPGAVPPPPLTVDPTSPSAGTVPPGPDRDDDPTDLHPSPGAP